MKSPSGSETAGLKQMEQQPLDAAVVNRFEQRHGR